MHFCLISLVITPYSSPKKIETFEGSLTQSSVQEGKSVCDTTNLLKYIIEISYIEVFLGDTFASSLPSCLIKCLLSLQHCPAAYFIHSKYVSAYRTLLPTLEYVQIIAKVPAVCTCRITFKAQSPQCTRHIYTLFILFEQVNTVTEADK